MNQSSHQKIERPIWESLNSGFQMAQGGKLTLGFGVDGDCKGQSTLF